MPFAKGQSGNPRGRPPGTSRQQKLRETIEPHIPAIVEILVKAAKDGDTAAARLLLDRTLPALKPTELFAPFPVRPGLADTGRAVLEGVANAQMTPEQGGKILMALASLGRVVEVDELTRRIEALEGNEPTQEVTR